MINRKVLMSSAEYLTDDAKINPYYVEGGAPIDITKAILEHQAVGQAFRDACIDVVQVSAPSDCQDGVYTANWALCRGDDCVIGRLPAARQPEEPYAERILSDLGKHVTHVPDGLRFSGQGDALPCGGYLLAGSGYRSDAEAQRFAADVLGFELVQLHTVPLLDDSGQPVVNTATGWPDSHYYDIDLAIAVIREDLIAYCPQAFDQASQDQIASLPVQKIEVTKDEAVQGLACNLVSTGETVIMSRHAPQLQAALEHAGLTVVTPVIAELSKGGGFIRCISLTLD